jgi:hypothetical protein
MNYIETLPSNLLKGMIVLIDNQHYLLQSKSKFNKKDQTETFSCIKCDKFGKKKKDALIESITISSYDNDDECHITVQVIEYLYYYITNIHIK